MPEAERHERDGEELGMPVRRVPLDDVVEAVLAGDVHNGTLMIAVLAAARLRDRAAGPGCGPVDEPWPTRPRGRSSPGEDRVSVSGFGSGTTASAAGGLPLRRDAARMPRSPTAAARVVAGEHAPTPRRR